MNDGNATEKPREFPGPTKYVYIYIYICTHTPIHVYTVYVYMYMYMYVCIYIYIYLDRVLDVRLVPLGSGDQGDGRAGVDEDLDNIILPLYYIANTMV